MVSLTLDTDCHCTYWFWIIIPIYAPSRQFNNLYLFKLSTAKSLRKSQAPLLVYLLREENRLTHGGKGNDSRIDDEASWLKYVEELDERKSTWLVNSATTVALVAKDRTGLGVNDTLDDISWDWLDTFESVADGDLLWVKFATIICDAGKNENKIWVSNLVTKLKNSAALHLQYPQAAKSHGVLQISARQEILVVS